MMQNILSLTCPAFQDLERRERQLRDEQKRLDDARVYGDRVPNFPPIPSFFPCTPCVYHNIDFDIPSEHQTTVRRVFYHWQCKYVCVCVSVCVYVCVYVCDLNFVVLVFLYSGTYLFFSVHDIFNAMVSILHF